MEGNVARLMAILLVEPFYPLNESKHSAQLFHGTSRLYQGSFSARINLCLSEVECATAAQLVDHSAY
jgi:hypothetical protein